MATVREAIDAQIAAVRAKADADVAVLQSQIDVLPAEVHGLAEEVWAKIKAFFGKVD